MIKITVHADTPAEARSLSVAELQDDVVQTLFRYMAAMRLMADAGPARAKGYTVSFDVTQPSQGEKGVVSPDRR